jgi:hypothetical protein
MKAMSRIGLVLLAVMISLTMFGQKKTHTVKTSRVINAPADQVWKVVGEDFGAIANSHPQIVKSDYINGTLKSGEGAERVCHFNEKGTKYLHEKQTNYDPSNYTFNVKIFHAAGLPMDPNYANAQYKVVPIDDKTSRFEFTSTYRTKPAFLGGLMKKRFQKTIENYAIAIEHHVLTGEKVNKENFKEIKKKYK